MAEMNTQTIWTVTELNTFLKAMMDQKPELQQVHIKGEISNFVHHKSGHLYFSLKDEGGLLRAVMFRGTAGKLAFKPENGMKVVARGSISLYVKDGSYQLYVTEMEPDGIGALYLAFEQLKRKLEGEGLFAAERKKPLPKIPMHIGVITSPTGAAIRDIIHILGRRMPLSEVLLYPALVQGEDAPASLQAGLAYFNQTRCVDVIILGRGGGSIEDLWAFNNETLARAVAASAIPVISAVGHETDFTICDFVADRRAPTPSAAAEIAVPEKEELRRQLHNVTDRMEFLLRRSSERARKTVELLAARRVLQDPEWLIRDKRMTVDSRLERLSALTERLLSQKKLDLGKTAASLDALSPLSILGRGYGVVRDMAGHTLCRVEDARIGEDIRVRLHDGVLSGTVTGIEKG